MDYLLDTNFVINYFKGIFEGGARKFTDSIINRTTFISVITRIELLGWGSIDPKDEIIITEFIADCIVVSLEENIKANKIKLPDAIIAATALENNMQLLSHNIKDFILIPNLIVVDANTL